MNFKKDINHLDNYPYDNCDNLYSEDWGWFVDIENMQKIETIYTVSNNKYKMKTKKISKYLNKLCEIKEEEEFYDEMIKNNDYDYNFLGYITLTIYGYDKNIKLISIGSTTLLTALMTYILLFKI